MGLPKLKTKIAAATYLEREKDSPIRSEFIAGEVYAMAGSTDGHQFICSNIFVSLFDHLRKSEKCRVFMFDMKVRVNPDLYYYPDILVACDSEPVSPFYRTEPVLVIEVSSPSSRETDRREKLQAYQSIPSVREYVVIEQDKMHIEMHRRQPNATWITYLLNRSDLDEAVIFDSVDFTTSIEAIYDRVPLPAENATE